MKWLRYAHRVLGRAQGQDGLPSGNAYTNVQQPQTVSPPPTVPLSASCAPPVLPTQQLLEVEDSLTGTGFNIGALKRPRSSGMPIPTSRPQLTVQPYPSPLETSKRSRSTGRTTVTHVPALQSSPPNFMRFGSLAETGPSTSSQTGMDGGLGGGLDGGLASAPANLTGGLLHTDLDTPLSSMEYELVESMAGSGGGSGSSGTALGGALASTADAHECADSKVRRRLAFWCSSTVSDAALQRLLEFDCIHIWCTCSRIFAGKLDKRPCAAPFRELRLL